MLHIKRRFGLIGLLGFEVGALVVLHRLGGQEWLRVDWANLDVWLATTLPEDALAAVLRLAGLAIAYWMLATTALYLLARLSQLPSALRAVEWATIPAVRRVVDGAVAVSIATASVAAPTLPALADEPTPVVITVDDEGLPVPPGTNGEPDEAPLDDIELIAPPGLERIGWTPQPAGIPDAGATEGDHRSTEAKTATVVVEQGDHLWAIAAARVESIVGAPAPDHVVAPYWRRLIDANVTRLRSGDPDLIYPGEVVVLPAFDIEGD